MAYGAEARKAVAEGRPTPKQKLLLRAIYDLCVENSCAPNFREIAERMGTSSTNGLTEGLNRLQREGWLIRQNLVPRSMRVTKRGIVAAGIIPSDWYFVADDPPR